MRFTLVDSSQEPQLRMLMRTVTMPGAIELANTREPDFFKGLCVEGTAHQVVTAVDNGVVVGMGVRSVRPMFIDGVPMEFGYLSGLRSLPKFAARQGWLVAMPSSETCMRTGACGGT